MVYFLSALILSQGTIQFIIFSVEIYRDHRGTHSHTVIQSKTPTVQWPDFLSDSSNHHLANLLHLVDKQAEHDTT